MWPSERPPTSVCAAAMTRPARCLTAAATEIRLAAAGRRTAPGCERAAGVSAACMLFRAAGRNQKGNQCRVSGHGVARRRPAHHSTALQWRRRASIAVSLHMAASLRNSDVHSFHRAV